MVSLSYDHIQAKASQNPTGMKRLHCLISPAVLQIFVSVQGFAVDQVMEAGESNLSARSSSVASSTTRWGLAGPLQAQATEEDTPLSLHNARSQDGSLSLAGSYLLQHEQSEDSALFRCTPIQDATLHVDHDSFPTESSRAWSALHTSLSEIEDKIPKENELLLEVQVDKQCDALTIRCAMKNAHDNSFTMDTDLIEVLSRILIQSLWYQMQEKIAISLESLRIVLLGATEEQLEMQSTDSIHTALFPHHAKNTEMVAMVDQHGASLGVVPRILVHKHNLLHRGAGILVTSSTAKSTAIYCHRRTPTKRIFPHLYDMFVGGVAVAGEKDTEETARRELSEELGLRDHPLQFLWSCIVCTSYNRCFVDVFQCNVDAASCEITWQEEEVAWGAWVPYGVVCAAADRSIERCSDWPGLYPKVQSELEGKLICDSVEFVDWKEWDFVPDGLLVWETWLRKNCTL